MRHLRQLIVFGLLLQIIALSAQAQAGWKWRWWEKDEPAPRQYCPPPCHGPQPEAYYGEYCYCENCQPKKQKEKKHCCCCRGDVPDLAPIVRSVAANITNQQAVPITQNNPSPIRMTYQPATDDGVGQEADRPSDSSLDSRVRELEQDLAETNRLLLEITKQLEAN